MYPVIFNFGSVGIYTYGMFVAFGLFTAIAVSKKLAAQNGISNQTITDIFFVILLSAIFGARLLYVFINFDAYQGRFFDVFKIWEGGLVFFGGFIAAVIAAAIYISRQKLDLWQTADILAPGIALGHAVGRVGCLFAGCCYGKTCDLPWAIQFNHPQTLAPMGIDLHPTQIYMVLSNLILFAILISFYKRKQFPGQVFIVYIMLYSLFRSFNEFFRDDFRGDFLFDFISLSQGISFLVSLGAVVLFFRLKNRSHDPN